MTARARNTQLRPRAVLRCRSISIQWLIRDREAASVFEKLQADYQRFLEIEQLLLDPEIVADPNKATALAKERGTLAKIAIPYGRYLELSRQLDEAEQLLASETDTEMRSYAEAELATLRARHEQEGEVLRDMLYDRTAGTESCRTDR